MANTIPGTGFRVRSPVTNAQDTARKWDGTSVSAKTLSDLKGVAVAVVTGPAANATIDLEGLGPVVGVSHIIARISASGQEPATLPPFPLEGTHYEVIKENPKGDFSLRELNGDDWSAHDWIVHYQPDRENIDIPQNERSTVFSPLPLS